MQYQSVLSFVSCCSHLRCTSRRFNCSLLLASLLQAMRLIDYTAPFISQKAQFPSKGKGLDDDDDSYHKALLWLVHFDPPIVPLFCWVAVPSAMCCCTIFLLMLLHFNLVTWTGILELKIPEACMSTIKNTHKSTEKCCNSGLLREKLLAGTMEQWEDWNAPITVDLQDITGPM